MLWSYLDTKWMHHDELKNILRWQYFLQRQALVFDGLAHEHCQIAMQW
jgi:hypothetical protein